MMSDGPAIALLATGSSEPCVDDASSFEAAVRARCAATGSSEPCVLDVGPLTSLRYAQGTLDLVRADLCAHLPPAAADAALAACARARVADAFALRRELVALKKVYFNLVIDGGALDKDLRQLICFHRVPTPCGSAPFARARAHRRASAARATCGGLVTVANDARKLTKVLERITAVAALAHSFTGGGADPATAASLPRIAARLTRHPCFLHTAGPPSRDATRREALCCIPRLPGAPRPRALDAPRETMGACVRIAAGERYARAHGAGGASAAPSPANPAAPATVAPANPPPAAVAAASPPPGDGARSAPIADEGRAGREGGQVVEGEREAEGEAWASIEGAVGAERLDALIADLRRAPLSPSPGEGSAAAASAPAPGGGVPDDASGRRGGLAPHVLRFVRCCLVARGASKALNMVDELRVFCAELGLIRASAEEAWRELQLSRAGDTEEGGDEEEGDEGDADESDADEGDEGEDTEAVSATTASEDLGGNDGPEQGGGRLRVGEEEARSGGDGSGAPAATPGDDERRARARVLSGRRLASELSAVRNALVDFEARL